MKRFVSVFASLLFLLFISAISFADPILLTDYEDLISTDNSIIEDNTILLNSGSFSIVEQIDIRGESHKNLVIDKPNTTLIIDNTGGTSFSLYLNSFSMGDNGVLISTGGAMEYGRGMLVSGSFTQNGGNITATGGNNSYSFSEGIVIVGDFTQYGGNLIAIGGEGVGAFGVNVSSIIQQEGTIIAQAGNGNSAYGLYVSKIIEIEDKLITNPAKTNPNDNAVNAIYFYNANDNVVLIFAESSELTVNVNLDFSQGKQVGLICLERGSVNIKPGASLIPGMINSSRLKASYEKVENIFIKNLSNDDILGTFDVKNTITIKATAEVKGNDYFLTLERIKTPADALAGEISKGAERFLDVFYEKLTENEVEGYEKANLILDKIDNFTDVDEAAAYVQDIFESVISDSGQTVFLWKDASLADLSRSNVSLSSRLYQTQAWLTPSFSINNYSDDIYSDVKGMNFNISLGGAVNFNKLGIAGQVGYIGGSFKGENLNTSGKGVEVFLAVGYEIFRNDIVSPKVQLHLGYMGRSIDVERTDILEDIYNSSMKQTTFNAGIEASVDIAAGNIVTIAPAVGLGYTYMKFNGYEEIGEGNLAVTVEESNFNSLDIKVGVNVEVSIISRLKVKGYIFGSYDVLGKEFVVEVNDPNNEVLDKYWVPQLSDTSRFSFDLGLGVTYEITNNVELEAAYSFYKNGSYNNHQFTINAGVMF